MTWRQEIRPLIRRALEDTRGLPYRERRRLLWDYYPHVSYIPRSRSSYRQRIWLDEVRCQLGHKKKRRGLKELPAQPVLPAKEFR